MESYIHSENTRNITSFSPSKNRISKWVSGSWKKSKKLIKEKINKGLLILPMYENEEWQTQISGKGKKDETIYEAAQREILEEVGIAFDIETLSKSYIDYEKFKGCDVSYFSVDLNDSIDSCSSDYDHIIESCKEREEHEDESKKRVSIFIHTDTVEDESINKILYRHRMTSDDAAGKDILLLDSMNLYKLMA